jgi:hypothetical protein
MRNYVVKRNFEGTLVGSYGSLDSNSVGVGE